jgi:multiple antibiotic resistance protein
MMDLSELTNWNEYVKLFVGLFVLVPPSIIVPFFLSLTASRTKAESNQMAAISSVAFAVTMIMFTFLGEAILNLFGITISAFRIAGGLLLLLMGIDMMRSNFSTGDINESSNASLISTCIVPLTIPILAGPGALSTIIILANNHEGLSHRIVVALVSLAVAVVVYLLFRLSSLAGAFFTETVSNVFNRIMGLIVTAMAVEFILPGLAGHLPELNILH